MNQEQPSLGEDFVRTLVALPKYVLTYVLGLAIVILNEVTISTLALTGVAVGFTFGSVLAGISTFFVLYSLVRIEQNMASAVVAAGTRAGTGQQPVFPPPPEA